VLPGVALDDAVTWARVAVGAADRQFAVPARAVVAGPDSISTATELRHSIDRVLDAAGREADLIDDVTTVERSRTGVLLGEIIGLLSENPDLVDDRVTGLVDLDARSGSAFTASLRAYLDHFGDVRGAAAALHVHPNTLRYRLRRIQALTEMDLDDPATRLVVALSLRVR
jgi:DNA-binding PucR family transcriptional regulator